jgi:bacteriocin-like protein
MFKTLNETELMTVNGGGKYVRGYKVVWRGSYYEKVWVGPVWVSSDYPYSEIRVY